MKDNPLVSVIIPNYNRANLIGHTIQSIIGQSYSNWEILIVDDGSTDRSLEVIDQYVGQYNNIKKFVRDHEPKGAPTCRNIGLKKCSGDLVIFLDSDDLLAPFCIEQRVALFFNNPQNDFIVFPMLLFRENVFDLGILWNIDSDEEDLVRFLRIDALWGISGPIYRKEALLRMRGFREDLSFWQDFDLHLRCLLTGLRYTKFMDLTPDVYIRKNLVDSISRSIPLVTDKLILGKRINFYFSLVEFIKNNNISISKECNHTVWSVLFYFTLSYLIRHKDLRSFLITSVKMSRMLQIGWFKFFLSVLYGLFLAGSRRIRILYAAQNTIIKTFKEYLPDDRILSNNTLEKKSWR